LFQVTKDHSVLNRMMEQGLQLSAEQRKKYKHVITQAIGVSDEIAPDVVLHKLEAGDIYLMCTDGLTDMVADNEIRDVMVGNHRHPDKLVDSLINLANARGGKDNITIVTAAILG
jgi:protein phosphatase